MIGRETRTLTSPQQARTQHTRQNEGAPNAHPRQPLPLDTSAPAPALASVPHPPRICARRQLYQPRAHCKRHVLPHRITSPTPPPRVPFLVCVASVSRIFVAPVPACTQPCVRPVCVPRGQLRSAPRSPTPPHAVRNGGRNGAPAGSCACARKRPAYFGCCVRPGIGRVVHPSNARCGRCARCLARAVFHSLDERVYVESIRDARVVEFQSPLVVR